MSTNLTDLDPRWVGFNPADHGYPQKKCYFGLSFNCPHCLTQRLVVYFKPFIDPSNFIPMKLWGLPDAQNPNTGEVKTVNWWARSGETFDVMSLTPSIDASKDGHWHGHITNGVCSP